MDEYAAQNAEQEWWETEVLAEEAVAWQVSRID